MKEIRICHCTAISKHDSPSIIMTKSIGIFVESPRPFNKGDMALSRRENSTFITAKNILRPQHRTHSLPRNSDLEIKRIKRSGGFRMTGRSFLDVSTSSCERTSPREKISRIPCHKANETNDSFPLGVDNLPFYVCICSFNDARDLLWNQPEYAAIERPRL